METIFFIIASTALGYIITTQEKLRDEISQVHRKVDVIELSMLKNLDR